MPTSAPGRFMRKAVFAATLLLSAGNLFAVCNPHLRTPDIAGEYPCGPGRFIDFVSASVSGNTLTLVKRLDIASPQFFMAVAAGKHFSSVELFVPSQEQKYTFTDVIIASVVHGASPAGETVTFQFAGFQSAVALRSPIRSFTVAGSAASSPVAIEFMGEPAAAFQTTVQMNSSGPASMSAILQMNAKPGGPLSIARSTGQQVQACTLLKGADGSPIAQYFFDGTLYPNSGNINIQKIQIQIPAAPTCGWSSTVTKGGWDLKNNIAM